MFHHHRNDIVHFMKIYSINYFHYYCLVPQPNRPLVFLYLLLLNSCISNDKCFHLCLISGYLGVTNTQYLKSHLNNKINSFIPSFPSVVWAGSRPKSWRHFCVTMSQKAHRNLLISHAQSSLVTESKPLLA